MKVVTRIPEGLRIRIYLQPSARHDKIVGIVDNLLKVAITAPPVDGKANAHLIKFFAKQFQVAKSRIILEKGKVGRHKQIKIIDSHALPPEIALLLCNS